MSIPGFYRKALRIWRERGWRGVAGAARNLTLGRARRFWRQRADRHALARLLDDARERPSVIIISTVDWGFPYRQRPQHMARALADSGVLVLYASPHGVYDDRAFPSEENVHVIRHYWPVIRDLPSVPVMLLSTDNRVDETFLAEVRAVGSPLIYDYIDEISEVISGTDIPAGRLAAHRQLVSDPSVHCLCSAESLYDEVRQIRREGVHLVTNGVALEDFRELQATVSPRDDFARVLDSGKPVIGYYGALAGWVDFEMVARVAESRPELAFVLIGPDYDGSVRRFGEFPGNVHVLPPFDYRDLLGHAAHFDVCIIPFRQNSLTEATSPLKLFEYMALGKPIVSTAIREASRYDSVLVADAPQSFAACLDRALSLGDDAAYRRLLEEEAQANSWESKVTHMLSAGLVGASDRHARP